MSSDNPPDLNFKRLVYYTDAEKVRFLNQYRAELEKKLLRPISDFDLLAYSNGEEFYKVAIRVSEFI
jgi:hypothetical protein